MSVEYSFPRVHHSHLINLNEVNKYIKGGGGYLLMTDGSTIGVSCYKKEILLNKLRPTESKINPPNSQSPGSFISLSCSPINLAGIRPYVDIGLIQYSILKQSY